MKKENNHIFAKYCIKRIISGGLHLFWFLPVQKSKVLFMNDHSYTFSDNLKYLALYMLEKEPEKYKIFFSLKDQNGLVDKKITPVKFLSLAHFYHALTSEIVVTNNSGIVYLPIRKKQLVINTWHGGGPYKVTGKEAINNKWYIKDFEYNSQKTDYILSSCRATSETEAPAMMYKKSQILEFGNPRQDSFFDKNAISATREAVFNHYKIPMSSKLVLYAPTFRGNFSSYDGVITDDKLEIDRIRLVDALGKRFGGKWEFAVRLHPRLKNVVFSDNSLINMTYYPDSEELLMAADVLITDYSSVMWDFSFSEKPIFLFAPDINDYEVRRGFYSSPEEWPFSIATSNNELEQNVLTFDEKGYKESVKKHHSDVGSFETGEACEKTKSLIDKHIDEFSKGDN